MKFDELADVVREHGASLAVEVTTAFLERHPDWRGRYGSRAMSAGVQDAGYHVAFLAAAVEADDPAAFADYARWTARVLAARGIERRFLVENLVQVQGPWPPGWVLTVGTFLLATFKPLWTHWRSSQRRLVSRC